MSLIVLSLFLSTAFALNYDVNLVYPPASECSGDYLSFSAGVASATCIPVKCTCGSNSCSQILCAQDRPDTPSGGQVTSQYPFAEGGCSGDPDAEVGIKTDSCFLCSSGEQCKTKIIDCNGGLRTRGYQTEDCSGDSTEISKIAPGCTYNEANKVYIYTSCPATCFHKDTLINYEGSQLKLSDLSAHSECAIPHRVISDGVKISTTCPGTLRLTSRHLVMTVDGYKEAGSLNKGDMLFSSVNPAGKPDCQITSIETEKNQEYFGLNCYKSDVLADGIWVSTFGIKHDIPAAWMKYAGAVFGIHKASSIGDSFVNMLSALGYSF